jgi:hypothetical protein
VIILKTVLIFKYLRESINNFNLSLSEDSLEDEIEIDCQVYEKRNESNKSRNEEKQSTMTTNIEKNTKCNLILKNIGNLDIR